MDDVVKIETQEMEECVMGDDGECVACDDMNDDCSGWANGGECTANAGYMLRHCPKSCDVCGKSSLEVNLLIQKYQQEVDDRKKIDQELIDNHGVKQYVPTGNSDEEVGVNMWWEGTQLYMDEVVYREARYERLQPGACQNRYEDCTLWASRGECQKNEPFMTEHCTPACRMCHTLIFEERCPYDGSQETNAWKQPGDLSNTFQRIITSPTYQQLYKPIRVLSRPGGDGDGDNNVVDGPWVVTMDHFLSKEECERLIEWGTNMGYEQSLDVGEKRPDGSYGDRQSKERTSTNTWCLFECAEDDATQALLARLEELTGIPDAYAEYLQLLKYEVGQHYGRHHDYIHHLHDRAEGPRILTVFLYLNDVPAGGGTHFPTLNLTVTPQQGRVLLWPSVLEEHPNDIDERTKHQAFAVQEGVKYAANAWYHQRDFKEPMSRGCTN